MHKPNHLLEFDVKDTLDWDSTIDDRRIEVNADDGHVTLTGSAPSYYEKVRATEDAWSVGGVKALDNEILVGLQARRSTTPSSSRHAATHSTMTAACPKGRSRRPSSAATCDWPATSATPSNTTPPNS